MSGSAKQKSAALMAAATLFFAIATVGPAAAQDETKLGLLECSLAPSAGLTAGSSKSVDCRFTDLIGLDSEGISVLNRPDFYAGSIDGAGLDTGFTQQQVVSWVVFGPASIRYSQGALAGGYAGVSAEAISGLGLGANVLTGGLSGSFVLQPFSDPAQKGANVATQCHRR